MNVRVKVLLLLGIVVLIFAGGLAWLRLIERQEFHRVAGEQMKEREAGFETFLKQHAEPLTEFTKKHSSWDGLVEAIEAGDRKWVEENLGDDLLSRYGTQVFWVYDKDRKLVYSRNQLYSDGLHEAPLPRSGFDEALGEDRLAEFFASSPAGVLEVRGATIHPTDDPTRTTEPQGFLYAARVWSPEELKAMAAQTGNELAMVEPKYALPKVNASKGEMLFSKLLPGWDGEPVMRLTAKHQSPLLAYFAKASTRLLIWLVLFVAAMLGVLAYALRRWVWRPLKLFSTSLRTDNLEVLRPLDKERGEIGELSRLIVAFFLQRESLLEASRAARETEKALEETTDQLRHGQKLEAVGRLAGGVAHDFSNLLTVIVGYAGLLRDKLRTMNLPVQESEAILGAGQEAALLTRQLLAFSQKQVLHPKVVDLNELVNDSERALQEVIGEHVEMRIRTEARQGRVRADPAQLKEVLLNLAENASDAMPRGGVLTITTGDTVVSEPTEAETGAVLDAGRYITLEVADTGTGIDPETEARIFEPFFTTKAPGKGTGLGLAAVYGIVAQSGGSISVKTTKDEGTTFLIHFPMDTAELEETPPAVLVPSQRGNGETILVLADQKPVRELVSTILEDRGYEVLSSDSAAGTRALAAEYQGRIHMLVSDTELHQSSDNDLAQELSRRWPELKMLFLSGYTEEPVLLDRPSIAIVEKPFTPDELAVRVRHLLDHDAKAAAGRDVGRSAADAVSESHRQARDGDLSEKEAEVGAEAIAPR